MSAVQHAGMQTDRRVFTEETIIMSDLLQLDHGDCWICGTDSNGASWREKFCQIGECEYAPLQYRIPEVLSFLLLLMKAFLGTKTLRARIFLFFLEKLH
jgi:hypothetical protein